MKINVCLIKLKLPLTLDVEEDFIGIYFFTEN